MKTSNSPRPDEHHPQRGAVTPPGPSLPHERDQQHRAVDSHLNPHIERAARDRAQGQVDDTLRHTITKLSHVHFPATRQSAQRILRLGEDHWRINTFGTPGIDGISTLATHRTHLERA